MRGYKKIFLDTNIFLRVLTGDDEKKMEECLDVFIQIKQGKIKAVTSALVIAELVWTSLKFYKMSKERVLEGLEGIKQIKNLKIFDGFDMAMAISFLKIITLNLLMR